MIDSRSASSRGAEMPEMGMGITAGWAPHSVNTLAGVRINSRISASGSGGLNRKP